MCRVGKHIVVESIIKLLYNKFCRSVYALIAKRERTYMTGLSGKKERKKK